MKKSLSLTNVLRPPAGAPQPQYIPHPGAYLLEPGFLEFSSEKALPFLSPDDERPGERWWEGPLPQEDDETGLTAASVYGKRAAAAYYLFVQANGPYVLSLSDMATTMAKEGVSRVSAVSFWSYLTRLLWLGTHHLTPVQVTADVEAEVAEEVDAD